MVGSCARDLPLLDRVWAAKIGSETVEPRPVQRAPLSDE
jgi:hypothetical protein